MTFSEILEKLHKILKLNSYGNNDACDQAQQLVNELKNSVNSDLYSLITPIIEKSQDSNFAIEIPESAQNFSNYFDPSVYQELLNYTTLAHYFEPNGIPEEQALKLSVLFGDCEAALKYISNNKSSLHDACLFQLPPVEECNFSLWQQHAKKSMLDYRFRKLLPNANEIEKLMFSAKKQKLDYQAINAKKNEINHVHREWKNLKRKHGTLNNAEKGRYQQLGKDLFQLNEELVPLCSGISLHNADLVILNAFYQHYIKTAHPSYQYFLQHGLTSKDYDKFVALNREQAGKNIPDLIIDGTEIGYPGFYLMKLIVQDDNKAARAACLGKLTNCCQSLSGEEGESCTIHGLTDPNGGFYVLCKGNSNDPKITDEMHGQTWVWRSQSSALVFDSIEVSENADKKMVMDFYRMLGKELISRNLTHRVNCGSYSGISNKVGLESSEPPEQFISYQGYCDSEEQRIIFKQGNPFFWFGQEHWYWYEIDRDYNELINKLLKESMQKPTPIAQSALLSTGINWAILNNKMSLLEVIRDFANSLGRSNEIEHVINSLHLFIANPDNLKEILKPYIIENQFYLDAINREGISLLMLASLQNDDNFVQLLIEKGADVHLTDNHGETALHFAAKSPPKFGSNTIKHLIENGVKIEQTNAFGKTALMIAVETDSLHDWNLCELIAQGANVNVKNTAGSTALMAAASAGNHKFLRLLINYGADINACTRFGTTALFHAIQIGNIACALELINHGADANKIDQLGRSSLSRAKSKGLDVVVAAIMEKSEQNQQDIASKIDNCIQKCGMQDDTSNNNTDEDRQRFRY